MRKYLSMDGGTSAWSDKRSVSVKMYKIGIDSIRALRKKNKRKIILKIKFLNYPNLDSADLQIYPGRSKGSDGTNEKPLTVPPYSPATALQVNAMVVGNSHMDLKKIFGKIIKKKDKGYFLFTPVMASEYPDNLVFNIKVHIDNELDDVDFGDSNPCPPAPPGGSAFKKKKKKKQKQKQKKN